MSTDQQRLTEPDGITGAYRGTTDETVVASYSDYELALTAVDRLNDGGIPLQGTTIVGKGLRVVEQPLYPSGWPSAVLQGVGTGAVVGMATGFVMGMMTTAPTLASALTLGLQAALGGAVIGGLLGLLARAMIGDRHSFTATSKIEAQSYDLVVGSRFASDARRILEAAG